MVHAWVACLCFKLQVKFAVRAKSDTFFVGGAGRGRESELVVSGDTGREQILVSANTGPFSAG